MERQHWNNNQESTVEKFYGKGVEEYGEHHGGYLNFGLWEEGITNYIAAAENLVKNWEICWIFLRKAISWT